MLERERRCSIDIRS